MISARNACVASLAAKPGVKPPLMPVDAFGSAAKLKTQVVRNDPLVAPIAKGQIAGTLRVTSGEQTVVDVPLVALDGVEQAGIFGRAWDAMRLWIR